MAKGQISPCWCAMKRTAIPKPCSALQIQTAISTFFIENDANEVAQALDITPDRLHAIQTGAALSNENLNDTAKLVALCLALETNALAQVEIAECLQDYPM